MPDLSLWKPLCEILHITINELLSGEKIKEGNNQEKWEENMMNTIDYSSKKMKQKNQMIGFILLLSGVFISTLGLMAFHPDSHSCSFSIIIGILLSTIGFFPLIKSKSSLKNFIFTVLFFLGYMGMILCLDYVGVSYNKRPPIFSTTITTIDDTIYYDTFFYDVVRCHKNTKKETFKIKKRCIVMSKYEPLWRYLKENSKENYKLSYEEIKNILGFDIDHSFLTYKKESKEYGYEVGKISMKEKTILFKRIV